MTADDRLTRYLNDQAGAITLAPSDPREVVRRGARRRTHRRVAVVACAATLGVVATTVAVDQGDGGAPLASGIAAAITPTSFDWTAVTPQSGLGYGQRSALLADGSLYSLSTAPGAAGTDSTFEPHLYRTADGTEWTEVSLPDGVKPSSLAASGSTLYALGTAPTAGGGRDFVLSASTDGAASWSQVALADEVEALDTAFPDEIVISSPVVAAGDGGQVAAAVVVTAQPDLERLVPDFDPEAHWAEWDTESVTILTQKRCEGDVCSDRPLPSTTSAEPPAADAGAQRAGGEGPGEEPEVVATYTWDELGLEPELRDLLTGRPYVYASDGTAAATAVALPAGTSGTSADLLATPEGFQLFLTEDGEPGSGPTTAVLSSPDGRTWTAGASLTGFVASSGVLGGRPAAATWSDDGLLVHVQQPDGAWALLDPTQAVDGDSSVQEVAFGPLGMVAIVAGDAGPVHVVHSLDGSTLSAVAASDIVGTDAGSVTGLAVTADAVLVRFAAGPDDDTSTPPVQRVLVGTPPG